MFACLLPFSDVQKASHRRLKPVASFGHDATNLVASPKARSEPEYLVGSSSQTAGKRNTEKVQEEGKKAHSPTLLPVKSLKICSTDYGKVAGQKISLAYKLCAKLIKEHYLPTDWNICAFYFSDGNNWEWEEDDADAFEVLDEKLLPQVNLFGYGQVYSHWGIGHFLYDLADEFKGEFDNLRLTEICSKDDIFGRHQRLAGQAL